MEPTSNKIRLKLILGKFHVLKYYKELGQWKIAVQLPSGIVWVIESSSHADVKEGDLLTFYTEVYASADSVTPSIQ